MKTAYILIFTTILLLCFCNKTKPISISKERIDLKNAIESCNIQKIKLLINNYSNIINEYDSEGRTPLIHALYKNDYKPCNTIINMLLQSGADVNKIDKQGNPPIFYAIVPPNFNLLNTLLKKGAKINSVNLYGQTILFETVISDVLDWKDTVSLIKIFVINGGNINHKDIKGYTALMRRLGSVKMELIEDDGKSHNPCEGIIGHDFTPYINVLVKYGADVNIKANDGATALSQAKETCSFNEIELLKSLGAKE